MIVFITIFGVGFTSLILSMIFGSDHDVDADSHGASHGPSVFSVKMISLLMVGFGATGFGFRSTTDWSMFQSSMGGFGGALIIGAIGYMIIRAFYASQESSTITDDDLIGQTVNLVDAIVENGNGQIACVVRGREITFLARTNDGSSLERGAQAKIISKSGNIVTVEKAD